jgi:hypothetical protein
MRAFNADNWKPMIASPSARRQRHTLRKKADPVPEKNRRRAAGCDIGAKGEARKLGRQGRLARGPGATLEAGQNRLGLSIEIAGGNRRKIIPFAGQEARDVAHILPLQRQGVALRVSLNEDEAALSLSGKDVDAGVDGSGQDLIGAGCEFVFPQFVETRMRDLEWRLDLPRQPVVGHRGAVVDP